MNTIFVHEKFGTIIPVHKSAKYRGVRVDYALIIKALTGIMYHLGKSLIINASFVTCRNKIITLFDDFWDRRQSYTKEN